MPLIVALAALALGGCDREPRAPAQPPSSAAAAAPVDGGEAFAGRIDRSHKGTSLPQATVIDPTGARLSVESLKGKPVLINLWATWCGPCVKELPTLDALSARENTRLAVVAISQDSGQSDKISAAMQRHTHLHAWLDPDNTLGFYYNSGVLPTSVLYDAQGREVWRMVGAHDWNAPDSAALLAPALG